LRVFPVYEVHDGRCACGKADCPSPGKHPRITAWPKEATTDKETITSWWRQSPNANIGIATGRGSGIAVLDVDPRNGGDESLATLQREHGQLPATLVANTGGGGKHYYFELPDGAVIGNSASKIGDGLDVRGEGGFVVAPPSIHASGSTYAWAPAPGEAKIAPAPAWLVNLNTVSGVNNHTDQQPAESEPVREGARNTWLMSIAGTLRARGLIETDLAAMLLALNTQRCQPPLPGSEVVEIAKNAAKYSAKADVGNPWDKAIAVKEFITATESEQEWFAKELVAPGSITFVASPRGIGKTHFAHALAIMLATGAEFRGHRGRGLRVLLLDRDNSASEIKRRLRKWGAHSAPTPESFKVLTRNNVPDLRDARAWRDFPFEKYDAVVLDSFSASTEGMDEREGGTIGKALAPVLDLARRGPAVLVLANTRKDGQVMRGSSVAGDRADIVYEVRDATNFTPDPKRAEWWDSLPDGAETAWASRAARRKTQDRFRLAFIPSKFRLGVEPAPFVLETRMPDDREWSMAEVTDDVERTFRQMLALDATNSERDLRAAVESLGDALHEAELGKSPLTVAEAEAFLTERGMSRESARDVIRSGTTWKITGTGKKNDPRRLELLRAASLDMKRLGESQLDEQLNNSDQTPGDK
jgi:hypothetical protein